MSHDPPARNCCTIGHGNVPVKEFIATLRGNGIDTVIDVRTSPFDGYRPDFHPGIIERTLAGHAIVYVFMRNMPGGRYNDPALLLPDGPVDDEKVPGDRAQRRTLMSSRHHGSDEPLGFP